MEREIIKGSKFEIYPLICKYGIENSEYNDYFNENGDPIKLGFWDEFDVLYENTDYVDLEKGFKEMSVFVERKSDKKVFKIDYTYSPDRDYDSNYILSEVFPTTKTFTIYK